MRLTTGHGAPGIKPHLRHARVRGLHGVVAALALLAAASAVQARELHSYARVNEDGSLGIAGETVHLDGIYLPPTGPVCESRFRPVRCGSRAVLALQFRIRGFVHCYPRSENADGSVQAVCFVDRGSFSDGEDLAAYLLQRGWALALPNAPFEYHALERIARHHNRGVWDYPADRRFPH